MLEFAEHTALWMSRSFVPEWLLVWSETRVCNFVSIWSALMLLLIHLLEITIWFLYQLDVTTSKEYWRIKIEFLSYQEYLNYLNKTCRTSIIISSLSGNIFPDNMLYVDKNNFWWYPVNYFSSSSFQFKSEIVRATDAPDLCSVWIPRQIFVLIAFPLAWSSNP